MPYFKDADDVYANLGRLMQEMAADPDLTNALKRADTTLQMRMRQPDSVITMRTPHDDQPAQVDLGETKLQPEVILQMDADTAHGLWLGEVNAAVALAKGDIRARGPVAKILKIVPLVKPGSPRYRTQLESSGPETQAEGQVASEPGDHVAAEPADQPAAEPAGRPAAEPETQPEDQPS
jgi:hypothetical protein